MIIPKYLQRPNMTEEEKRRMIEWIKTKREKMRKAPTFESESEAIKVAVRDPDELLTVWREPEDIGQKYAVVPMELREDAGISGYTETVGHQKVYDLAKNGIDEIEEV